MLNEREAGILYPNRKSFPTILVLLLVGCGAAMAETGHSVHVPLTLPTWTDSIRTTACLQVSERAYPSSPWWESTVGKDDSAEDAFGAVIIAIKRKDRAALLKASDPQLGRDPARFEQQAEAFFQQFQVAEILSVPRAYEFDGLIVFFAKIRYGGETAFAPFAFSHQEDGKFGFLPYRTRKLSYMLVQDWFQAPWGPGKTDRPVYCADENIKGATHRVSLAVPTRAGERDGHLSQLFLTGASTDTHGRLADLSKRGKST